MISKVKHRFYPSSFSLSLVIAGLFLGAVLTCSLGAYLDLVEQLGFRLRQDDVITDFTTAMVWAFFLGICIVLSPVKTKDKNTLLLAWFLKCLVSLCALLFYEAHFPSDAEGFWYHSLRDQFLLSKLHSTNGLNSYSIVFLIQIYNKIVPDVIAESFHSLKISFSMLGLMAVYLFYRASVLITKKENRIYFWFLILYPSLLIYTSRIGKESVMVFGMALYVSSLVAWHYKRRAGYILICFIGLLICTYMRAWMAPLLLGALFLYFLLANKNLLTKVFCMSLTVLLILPSYNLILSKFNIKDMVEASKHLGSVAESMRIGGSKIEREPIVINGPLDAIKFAPFGAFTALFRPLPGDVKGLLGLLSGVEGLILLYLFLVAVKKTQMREINDPIVIWAISLVLFWAFLYGFAIQNFGTGIRWKTQILPVFIGLLFYLGRHRQKVI